MAANVKVTRTTQRGKQQQQSTEQMRVVAAIQLGDVARDLAAASGMSVVEAARKVVKDAATQTVQLAQVYAPRKSGALRRSIDVTYEQGGLQADVMPDTEYASYVEFGTGLHNTLLPLGSRKPYVIEPKEPGGSLKFTAGDGSTVFAKRVIHPGIKPQPYMAPAAERVADSFAKGMLEAGTKVIVEGEA